MTQIILVGGGVIGMLTALELQRDGHHVTLIEQGELGQESSWAGGGIVSPLYPWRYAQCINELAAWSQQAYPALCSTLHESTGIDPEYVRSGLLLLGLEDAEEARSWVQSQRVNAEFVDDERVLAIEPALVQSNQPALWMSEVAQVRNPRLVRALAAEIKRIGIEHITHRAVTSLLLSRGYITGVQTPQGAIHGDAVVICAGAWTRQLLEGYGAAPEIRPVRGQMLCFKTEPGLVRRMVLEESRYIIPRRDGRILFGSTLEEVGFDKRTSREAFAELHEIAVRRFPGLRAYPVENHWAGLRPGTPGGVPYIAAHPEVQGLFVNAGHFRNGVVLGPASARLCADLVSGKRPAIDPSAFTFEANRD